MDFCKFFGVFSKMSGMCDLLVFAFEAKFSKSLKIQFRARNVKREFAQILKTMDFCKLFGMFSNVSSLCDLLTFACKTEISKTLKNPISCTKCPKRVCNDFKNIRSLRFLG